MNMMKTTTFALVAMLLGTSFASAGGLHIPGLGDSGGDVHESRDNGTPDFGSIFNPQPEPEITVSRDLFEVLNPQVDMVDLGVDMGGNGVPGKGKGAKLSAKVKFGAILKCSVAGTPSEFPDDLRIANAGVVAIPAGTQFKWKVQGASGIAALGQALQPGKSVKLNGVLDGGVEAGTVCSAKANGL
jgi:hypothetical protein